MSTPGPWTVTRKHLTAEVYYVDGPNGEEVCVCYGVNAQENARQIASQPALLEACKALLRLYVQVVGSGDCGNWDPEEEKEVIAARSAIAQAEPEAQP